MNNMARELERLFNPKRWTANEETQLLTLRTKGTPILDIANIMQRGIRSIEVKLAKLNRDLKNHEIFFNGTQIWVAAELEFNGKLQSVKADPAYRKYMDGIVKQGSKNSLLTLPENKTILAPHP